jgi:hypothetical protein
VDKINRPQRPDVGIELGLYDLADKAFVSSF